MNLIETQTAEGLLTLTAIRGIGPAMAMRLAEKFVVLNEIIDADKSTLKAIVPSNVADILYHSAEINSATEKVCRVLDEADKQGVRVLSVFDKEYPHALKSLNDRPPLLFIKGKLPSIRSVASIGTREPSEFGEVVCERLVETLVGADWTIISGLALGIDTFSHKAALRHHGKTVAIMAGGLDNIYPKPNKQLADEILANDGALISEHPFGIPPSPRNLVQRDRLQSGLSIATFVMQTDIKGGSMHTVRFTIQQNRLLFAPVPQGKHSREEKSQGILALTQMYGSRFADAVQAEGEYRRILLNRYRMKPVAIPLSSKEDYASMLSQLEARITESPQNGSDNLLTSSLQLSML